MFVAAFNYFKQFPHGCSSGPRVFNVNKCLNFCSNFSQVFLSGVQLSLRLPLRFLKYFNNVRVCVCVEWAAAAYVSKSFQYVPKFL